MRATVLFKENLTMAYEQRDLSGSVFKNDRKTEEKHPDITGSCLIGGEKYYISGWRKTKDDGEGWYSLSFTPASERERGPARGGKRDATAADGFF